MKRNLISIIIVAGVAIIGFTGVKIFASSQDNKHKYTIENNPTSIEVGIENKLNSSSKENTNNDIQIQNTVTLDNKTFVLFTLNNKIGFSELSTGENGLLGIDYESVGDAPIKVNFSCTNNGQYLVVFGKNYEDKVKEVSVDIADDKINIPVSDDNNYFIAYKKLDKTINESDSCTVNMYDKHGREITVDVYKNFLNA